MRNALLLLIAGVTLATLWMLYASDTDSGQDLSSIASTQRAGEDRISLGVIRIVERRESKTLFELMAQSAMADENQTDASLTLFSLLAYPDGGEPFTFAAGRGELINQRTEVVASGGAIAVDRLGRTLLTDSLTMYDKGERFETDDKVWIMGPNFAISGVGMVARPALKTVELKSNVIAVFNPGTQ